MFSLDTLKNTKVENKPWDHIVIENYIDSITAMMMSQKLQDTFNWEYDDHPDMKGYVKVAHNIENFEYFNTENFCKVIVEKFGHILPANYLATQTNTWHTKGASLPAHTDMHCIVNTNKKFNKDYRNCLTWQLYLPDTDQYPESGVWLHEDWDDKINGRKKVKQIPCFPGMFFAYINTNKSYHSVPEQNAGFNRVSHMGRIYW